MKKKLFVFICLLSLFASGCAQKWVIDGQVSLVPLVWPKPPDPQRIRHIMTIKGFSEKGKSLKGILVGKGGNKLMKPVAVTTGHDGRIAIADTGTQSVHIYIPKEEKYIELYQFDTAETMISPVSVTFDDELRLYVSDSFYEKVGVFDAQAKYLYSIDRKYKQDLKRPTGLAYDFVGKRLFVVDTPSHMINVFSQKGENLFSFGSRGTDEGQFNFPTHIFWSKADLLYVTDSMNYRVEIFHSSGKFHSSFGRQGDGSGDFAMPKGIAVDKNGIVYVVDSLFDNVQLFDEIGEFLLTVGRRGISQGEFWLPSGIFIDESDKLYVCDTYNQRIQIFEIISQK